MNPHLSNLRYHKCKAKRGKGKSNPINQENNPKRKKNKLSIIIRRLNGEEDIRKTPGKRIKQCVLSIWSLAMLNLGKHPTSGIPGYSWGTYGREKVTLSPQRLLQACISAWATDFVSLYLQLLCVACSRGLGLERTRFQVVRRSFLIFDIEITIRSNRFVSGFVNNLSFERRYTIMSSGCWYIAEERCGESLVSLLSDPEFVLNWSEVLDPLSSLLEDYFASTETHSAMGSWSGNTFEPTSNVHKEICSAGSHDSGCTSVYLGGKEETSIRDLNVESEISGPPPSFLWYRFRAYGRDAFSEFFGTLILILFGDGVVAQVLLSHDQKGDYQSISWGWGWVLLLFHLSSWKTCMP